MIPARVLVSYGSHGIVSCEQGVFDCRWRRSAGRPLCGDLVQISLTGPQEAALEAIEKRSSEFSRGDARGRPQLIAANVEQVVIIVAPAPAPSAFMVDRYLVAVAAMQLDAVLVINKADQIHRCPGLREHMAAYADLGVQLVETSTKGAPGSDSLAQVLRDRISILVGQSGVGKSSLINAMVPDRDEQTGALSEATGKGRHTTTRTLWIQLPQGGAVIDSPGVWEYGLWRMEAAKIARCFPDFLPFLGQCRFRDCSHSHEPECALHQAIADGQLKPQRLEAFHNILQMQN